MLRLRAFRPSSEKIVKIQMHPTHPWLVTADASDHVSVWNWEHRQVIYELKAGGIDQRRLVGAKLEKLAEGESGSIRWDLCLWLFCIWILTWMLIWRISVYFCCLNVIARSEREASWSYTRGKVWVWQPLVFFCLQWFGNYLNWGALFNAVSSRCTFMMMMCASGNFGGTALQLLKLLRLSIKLHQLWVPLLPPQKGDIF